jgi:glycosyltransferase involved in cell wall biosynthesis
MLGALIPSKLRRFTSFLAQGEFVEAFWYIVTRIGIPVSPPLPLPRARAAIASSTSRPQRITIAACTHSLSLEGAPISLLEILVGLIATSRYEIHLISPTDGELRERAEAAGIHIHLAASVQDRAFGQRSYEPGIAEYARLLESVRADVVIANCVVMFHAVDAARSLGIPSLWVIREEISPQTLFSLYPRAVQRRALACLDYPSQTIFVSESTLNRWPATEGARVLIRTVPDRADIARLVGSWTRSDARKSLGITDEAFAILTVGTLCANKGQLDLVGAARLLADLPLRIIFVGTPAAIESEPILKAITRSPPALQNAIELHPVTSDIGRFYAAADVYVCSSRSESYPRTILEALAFGLPIVTTLVGGIPEALAETQVQSFKPGDIEELAAALLRVVRSSQLKTAMSDASSKRWADIAKQAGMIESYTQAIDRALSNESSSRP